MKIAAKLLVLAAFSAVAVLGGDTPAAVSVRPETVAPRDVVTNESLVLLSEAGFSDAFIVQKICLSRTRLDTSPEGLAYLRRNAISEELALFALEYTAKPAVASGTQAPAIVPVKVAKRKVLVPIAPPAGHNRPAFYPEWYGSAPVGAGYGWPAYPQPVVYATPGRPLLQSPAFPASAPVLTPMGAAYTWNSGR